MSDGILRSLAEPSRPRKPYALAAIFLALSFLLSVALLSVRNIYDDEYSNFAYVTLSVPQVIHMANSGDVHPPGMYLLSRFAYQAIPSPRWMTIFTLLVLEAGLAAYLFSLTPLFPTAGSRLCFLLLASLHPQLLMWGNTIRWYGWWTGLALITLVVALQPRVLPSGVAEKNISLGYGRAAALGLLLVGLFYLNYITLVFGAALGLTMLFRYSWRPWKQYLVTIVIFAALIFPQIHYFLTVHIPGGQGQRSSFPLSLARLVEATLCSEAYLPWHPLAVCVILLFLGLIAAGLLRAYRLARSSSPSRALLTEHRGLASIVLFSVVFFCLVAAAGFGVKPRNGLLLIPALAAPAALVVGSLRARLQALVLVILALWSGVGIEHLIGREGLTKSNMNNRPEELTSYIRQAQGPDCSVVVTYDSLLALTVSTSRLQRLLLLTPAASPLPLHERPLSLAQCPRVDLYRVKSYLGGMGIWGKQVSDEMDSAYSQPGQILNLSHDPEAAHKRKLTFVSGASDLPDYRYVVTVNRISAQEFISVEEELHHYAPIDGQPKPVLESRKAAETSKLAN